MKDNFQFSIFNFQKMRAGILNSFANCKLQIENCRVAAVPQRGFTILLAALVASLVLALGISVFTIAQKQIILSSLGKNSQYAFYAADTGAECGLFWDLRFDFFATSAPAGVAPSCDDVTFCAPGSDCANGRSSILPYTMTFEFEPNGYCARVEVTKATVHPRTTIHADGFSTPCEDIETNARALQRSVELTY